MGAVTQSSLSLAVAPRRQSPIGQPASLWLSAAGAEAGIVPGDGRHSGGGNGFGQVDFSPFRPCRSSDSDFQGSDPVMTYSLGP